MNCSQTWKDSWCLARLMLTRFYPVGRSIRGVNLITHGIHLVYCTGKRPTSLAGTTISGMKNSGTNTALRVVVEPKKVKGDCP